MTINIAKLLAMITFATTAAITMPSSAQAQDKTDNQTMPSGRDVWRVELRNFDRLLLLENADSDGTDELHFIEVTLANEYAERDRRVITRVANPPEYQFDSVKEKAVNLSVNDRAGNRAYVSARRGDYVDLSRRPNTTYNLWIHTKEFRESADLSPVIFFTVSVKGRELSCFRKRVCKRGHHGEYIYQFNVPVPTVRSSRCVAANTFDIATSTDGIAIRARSTGELTEGWDVERAPARKNPQLFVKTGEICIASTSR